MKSESRIVLSTLLTVILALLTVTPASATEKFGIFETIHRSSISFGETSELVESGLRQSSLELHAVHDVRVPDNLQQARIFVLTSPDFLSAADQESPRTVSAQIMRVAVFTIGEEQQTFINMSSARAHAMVYYTHSDNYDRLLLAAAQAAQAIRNAIADVPGESLAIQQEPQRSEKHYRVFKGDGPARMMAKFRNYEKSQLQVVSAAATEFRQTVVDTSAKLSAGVVGDATDRSSWEIVAEIPIGSDAVYFGLSNPYLEDRMIRINSSHRSANKSKTAPYPGVDHVTALPTDVLVIKEDGRTKVLQYGQMWRMQLYFWDSGYRAFTANAGMPGKITRSIRDALSED